MNLTKDTTNAQDDAISALRRRHNRANPNNQLTARQWIDRRIDGLLDQIVAEAATFVGANEVADAFKAANNATRAVVKTALGL